MTREEALRLCANYIPVTPVDDYSIGEFVVDVALVVAVVCFAFFIIDVVQDAFAWRRYKKRIDELRGG